VPAVNVAGVTRSSSSSGPVRKRRRRERTVMEILAFEGKWFIAEKPTPKLPFRPDLSELPILPILPAPLERDGFALVFDSRLIEKTSARSARRRRRPRALR